MSLGRADLAGYNIMTGYYSPVPTNDRDSPGAAREDRFVFISQNRPSHERFLLYNALIETASNADSCWVWKKHIINAFKDCDEIHSCSFVPTNPTKIQTLFLRKDFGVDSLDAMFEMHTVSHSLRPPFPSYRGPVEAEVRGDPDYWIFEVRERESVIPFNVSEDLYKKLQFIIGCFVCDSESREITLGFMQNGVEAIVTWSKG